MTPDDMVRRMIKLAQILHNSDYSEMSMALDEETYRDIVSRELAEWVVNYHDYRLNGEDPYIDVINEN